MTNLPLTPEPLALWTDGEVLRAWLENDWTPGEANADALAAEIERRNLDFSSGSILRAHRLASQEDE